MSILGNVSSGATRSRWGNDRCHKLRKLQHEAEKKDYPDGLPGSRNSAQSAHQVSVSTEAMPAASLQHCSSTCIRIAQACRFLTHNQIHNQSYLSTYLSLQIAGAWLLSLAPELLNGVSNWKQMLPVYLQLTSPASSSFLIEPHGPKQRAGIASY